MNSADVWKLLENSLEKNVAAMLLYVVESSGSSPGRQGFLMAVNANGEMAGSVGGGIMEFKFVEMSKAKLREPGGEASVHRQVHNKSAAKHQSGMICSGEQTIVLYRLQPKDAMHVNAVISCLEQNRNGLLSLSPAGISFIAGAIPPDDHVFTTKNMGDWEYAEKVGHKNHLFIVGAGHCALALSRIMNRMDFYIHLYDDRTALKTMEENTFVDEKMVVEDYNRLSEIITGGKNHYVVIMTVGYRTDMIALKTLIDKNFTYLGVLGSQSKIEKVFSDLQMDRIDEEKIKRVHAPIGIPIRSHTPEEVAISIAAEIIKVKNSESEL